MHKHRVSETVVQSKCELTANIQHCAAKWDRENTFLLID